MSGRDGTGRLGPVDGKRRWYALAGALAGLLTAVLGAPAASAAPPDLDVDRATAALAGDPLYLAPRSIARMDKDQVRRELAGTRIVVVVEPFIPDEPDRHDHDGRVKRPLAKWSDANDRPVVLVTGLLVSMPSIDRAFTPEPADYRDALERYDVTRPVLQAIRYLRDGSAPHEPWRPRVVPPDPHELARIVAGLRTSRMYVEPGQVGVRMQTIDRLLGDGPTYRVVRLRALIGDEEPDLLPGLAAAFPGELIIVLRGRWLTATGLPPGHIASGQAALYRFGPEHLMAYGRDTSVIVYTFLDRIKALKKTPLPYSGPNGIDADGIAARLAPWMFAAVALLLGGGVLLFWTRRMARGRREAADAVESGGAEMLARLARLGGDLQDLDPGDDLHAARRLADAAERYATARDLHDRADTPEEVEAVLATLVEGEAYADDVRRRRGLPVRGDAR